LAAAAVGVSGLRAGRSIGAAGAPPLLGTWYAARSTGLGLLALGRTLTMHWPGVLAAGLLRSGTRRAAFALLLAPPLTEAWMHRAHVDPVRLVAAALVDDLAYGLGVWSGCVREGHTAPLRPAIRRR
jgi:hypothetical protein